MAREYGTYFLMADYRSSDGIGTHHIPIQYGNGEAHLLMCDYDNDCWTPVGNSIMNFGEMTEMQIFEVVKKTNKFYSSLNEGNNYRLKHLKLDCGQSFNSIYRPIFTYNFTEDFQATSQSETSFIECDKDHKVRAVWDGANNQWWFSVLDIVGAINQQDDHEKNRNYWKYLKAKLRKEENELVSATTQLKLTAADGKKYKTDVVSQVDVEKLAKVIPNNQATAFLDWFTYNDNTIDGRSKKKAYTFIESNLVADKDVGTVKALQQIHAYIFGGLYDFAGKIRTKTIAKGNTLFCLAEHLHSFLKTVEAMPENAYDEIVDKYVEMNAAHPFMEGNGRSTRIWLDLIFKKRLGLCVDWSQIDKREYLDAMIASQMDSTKIRELLKPALTNKIDDREIFMKGIDYSYYYEQED